MHAQRIAAIIKKDLKEVAKNSQIIYPLLIMPLVFVGVLPTALVLSVRFGSSQDGELASMIERFPAALLAQLAGYTEIQKAIYFMAVYMMSSMFLIIPILVSMMIAANSFAGEKERKTLEGLLYTPITDRELVIGKIMAAFIPAMLISWVCFALYTVIVNALAYPVFEGLFFPTINWWVMMVWLVPATSFLAIGVIVLISSKVRGYQEANSVAGAIVLPIVLTTVAQMSGVMYLSAPVVFLAGLLFAIIDALLLWLITGAFHRDRLVAYIK